MHSGDKELVKMGDAELWTYCSLLKTSRWYTIKKNAITVVESGSNESLDDGFCSRKGKGWKEGEVYLFKMKKKSGFGDEICEMFKWEMLAREKRRSCRCWCRRFVLWGFSERFGTNDDYIQFITRYYSDTNKIIVEVFLRNNHKRKHPKHLEASWSTLTQALY